MGESDFAWQSLRAHTVEVWAFRQNEAAVASLSNRNLDEIREILSDLEELQDSLPKRFNRPLFRRVRRLTGTQAEWAELANVTQTTIGNWERGYTAPNRYYRASLFHACEALKAKLSETPSGSQFELGRRIDPVRTSRNLDRSILRAALTDFDYDSASRKIVPIPFSGDFDEELAAEIAEDRSNLLASLKQQAGFIADSISENANLNEKKIVKLFQQYAEEVDRDSPNPRLLNRLGATISRAANGDDFRGAANDIDLESIDGFNRDHLELMRLYFKEALSKAQELDGTEVIETGEITDDEFRHIAGIMEQARTESGEIFVDSSIPTLLKDIASEIRDLNDAITLTNDERRADVFQRRKHEAFKNGGVYVGRFVFFGALLASVAVPGVAEIMTALSLIIAVSEGAAPGTIRDQYERLRQKFPALPALPERSSDASDRDDHESEEK